MTTALFIAALWALLKTTEKYTYLLYLMCDTIWTWQFSHSRRPEWDARLDRFAAHLCVIARTSDAQEIVLFYSRRFETEETYKDYKDVRGGMQLKGSRITTEDRLSRLIAAQTIAYWLMSLAGLYGEEKGLHRKMQANTIRDKRVLALWKVGRKLLRTAKIQGQHLLGPMWRLLEALSGTYGGRLCPS